MIPFIKANVVEMVKAACDPARAIMATVMGVPPIMKYIEDANKSYQEVRAF